VPLAASEHRASPGLDISFGDDEGTASNLPGDDQLDNLFSDNEEVQAARDLQSATAAVVPNPFAAAGRTASANPAKKLGNVKPSKGKNVENILENIWERPQ
jgi:hypothetical protein